MHPSARVGENINAESVRTGARVDRHSMRVFSGNTGRQSTEVGVVVGRWVTSGRQCCLDFPRTVLVADFSERER